MSDFIYDRKGNGVGFIEGEFIHSLSGQPIGQVRETHVYKISGEYIGELYNGMVVDMNLGTLESIGYSIDTGYPVYRGIPENRGAVEAEFTEVFYLLSERINYIDNSLNNFGYLII